MRRYILCGGLDYSNLSSDIFVNYCQKRAQQIIGQAPRGEDLWIDIYAFRSGTVHSRKIAWKNGKAIESTSVDKRYDPITKNDFERRESPEDNYAFKAGRPKVMSIRNIYDDVAKIGADAPNTLEEFSIFSHAYIDGPILVNSYDDRRVMLPARLREEGATFRNLQGTERNPDDKDCRSQYDFVAPTMPFDKLRRFRAAFSPRGRIWIWGCNMDQKANQLLSHVRRIISGKGNLNDGTILQFKNMTKLLIEAFKEFDDVFKLDQHRMEHKFQADVSFGKIRQALWSRMTASYVCQAAQAVRVPVIGAMYGTYASFDVGSPPLLGISTDTVANVHFYRNHLGLKTDPEGRNFGIFAHDMKVTGIEE